MLKGPVLQSQQQHSTKQQTTKTQIGAREARNTLNNEDRVNDALQMQKNAKTKASASKHDAEKFDF